MCRLAGHAAAAAAAVRFEAIGRGAILVCCCCAMPYSFSSTVLQVDYNLRRSNKKRCDVVRRNLDATLSFDKVAC